MCRFMTDVDSQMMRFNRFVSVVSSYFQRSWTSNHIPTSGSRRPSPQSSQRSRAFSECVLPAPTDACSG